MQEPLGPDRTCGRLSDEAAPGPFGTRDQRRIKVGSTFAHPLAPGSGDAGGEEAEIVGQRAVGEVGDACAQGGDRLGR